MATVGENTKFTLPVVVGLVTVVAGGVTWVNYITGEIRLIRKSITKIERKLKIEPSLDGSSSEAIAGGRSLSRE